MKVLYVVSDFPKLSETFVLGEVLSHMKAGIDISVLSVYPGTAGVTSKPGLPPVFHTSPQRSLARHLPLSWRLRRFFAAGSAQPDIIHCHFGTIGRALAPLRREYFPNAALVTTFHGFDMSQFLAASGHGTYNTLFREGDLFLPVSELWRDRLRDLGCPVERIRIHHMGVDTSALRPDVSRKAGLPLRLSAVGRLLPKKGHLHTLAALAALSRRRPEFDWTLDLVGEGGEFGRLRRFARKAGLESRVRFHGGVSHAEALGLVARSDLFVLPSMTADDGDMEGIPVALMEAMALGRAVASTRHSGIPELVDHGVSGLLSAEGDDAALSGNIETLLNDPGLRERLGRAGRERVERDFNLDNQTSALRAHYTSLARRPS